MAYFKSDAMQSLLLALEFTTALWTFYKCLAIRVSANWSDGTQLTFCGAGKAEWHHGPDDTEDLSLQQSQDLASIWVWPDEFQAFAMRDQNLLNLRAREISVDGMSDAGGSLKRHVVQIHG